MKYDHMRRSVESVDALYLPEDEVARKADFRRARCPDCEGEMNARRPAEKRWHWYHMRRTTSCEAGAGESDWHYAVKDAFEKVGYELEWRNGRWRYDAYKSGADWEVVEAVNSLSDRYFLKLKHLKEDGISHLWVINAALDTKAATGNLIRAIVASGGSFWFISSWQMWDENGETPHHPAAPYVWAEVNGTTLEEAQEKITIRIARDERLKRERQEEAEVRAKRAAEEADEKRRTEAFLNSRTFLQSASYWRKRHQLSNWDRAKAVAWLMNARHGRQLAGMPATIPPLSATDADFIMKRYKKVIRSLQ
ncbi:hypothetical protein K7W03_23455 [Sphingobium sp. PNB]|uniref:hypothetical protein n=1 Tax=Sphingobium sp. PNB TaxID=863934 RepID=UPI001CA468BB|nr:hypothetical protein [Sphingobium sp. PNB]MCB4862552.1 hypothetical protein [Sphingobium sp. PNB]